MKPLKPVRSRPAMSRKRAFTLIELLVVIAIIAILAAILFPVFAQAKAAAKTITTVSNNKQQILGLQMYINDYDDTAFLPWEMGIYPAQVMYPYTKNLNVGWDASSPIPNYNYPMTGNIPGDSPQYWGDWTLIGTISWNQQGLEYSTNNGPNMPRVLSAQENPAQRAVTVSFSNPANDFGNAPSYITGDLGWFTFDSWNESCYEVNGNVNTWEDTPQAGIGRAANLWHTGGFVTGYQDGHAANPKGMVYLDPTVGDCGPETAEFWSAGTNGGANFPTDQSMSVPDNPWSAFMISPRVLNYWGTWWDSDK